MFGRRPKIDTTFGVPMDLNAPSGAMITRDKAQKKPSKTIPPKQTFNASSRAASMPKPTTRQPHAATQPAAWGAKKATPQDMSGFMKYLLPPIGMRASIAIAIGAWVFLGPVLFFLAAAAHVGIAYFRWQQSQTAK